MNERKDNPEIIQDQRNQPNPSAQQKRPVKGRYLKQSPTPARRRRRRRKLNPRFVILMAILLAMLIGIAFWIRGCSKPTIIGRWDLDGTTVYQFREDGKGALILMNAEYEFVYEVEENIIHIDFVDERCLDADYSYELEENLLFWTGGHGDAKNDFVLTRIS